MIISFKHYFLFMVFVLLFGFIVDSLYSSPDRIYVITIHCKEDCKKLENFANKKFLLCEQKEDLIFIQCRSEKQCRKIGQKADKNNNSWYIERR